MWRVVIEVVLPLLLPTALYLLWLRTLRPLQHGGAIRWPALPWLWLGGAGIVLLAIVLYLTEYSGGAQDGVYVPPHLEGGRVVPGHFEPKARP